MRRSIRSLSAAAAVCLVLAACGAAPGQRRRPSRPAPPSPIAERRAFGDPCEDASDAPTPSAEPSASVPGDSVPIPPDTYARVVTDDLRVRSKPGVSDDSKKLEPLLQERRGRCSCSTDRSRPRVTTGIRSSRSARTWTQRRTHSAGSRPPARMASRGSNHVPRDARRAGDGGRPRLDHPDGADVLRDHLLRRGRDHVPGSDRLVRNRLRSRSAVGSRSSVARPLQRADVFEPIEAPANSWRLVPHGRQASTRAWPASTAIPRRTGRSSR